MSEVLDQVLDVSGFKIRIGGLYKVVNKPDSSAPDGFQELGTTKLPSDGIGNVVPMRYVITDKVNNRGRYDTGFESTSPMYARKSAGFVEGSVSSLREHIVIPYERKYGKPGLMDSDNESFWDSYGVDLHAGRVFNTENVDDLLGLYVAIITNELAKVSDYKNPKYREAAFMVQDKEQVREVRITRASQKLEAIRDFSELLRTNRKSAVDLLTYCDMSGITDTIDESALNATFMSFVDNYKNVEKFRRAFKLVANDKTRDVVGVYSKLLSLVRKNKVIRDKAVYYMDGEELGHDLKTIAQSLITDSSKQDLLQLVITK